MKALVLHEHGRAPRLGDFPAPPTEDPAALVTLSAAGLNPFDVVFSAGRHPVGRPEVPSIVGREGVGSTSDGRRVYFDGAQAPYGSMAMQALVARDHLFDVPSAVDDATAIALGAAGIAAWVPLADRARVTESDRVLVLGATGAVGSIAVQVAKLLGARRVVAAGRRAAALQRCLDRGADAIVDLEAEDVAGAMREAADGEVDVVIDLLWGEPARAALELCALRARYVQIGSSAGADVMMPANPWRSRWVSILGYSSLRLAPDEKRTAYAVLLDHAVAGRLAVDTQVLAFDDAEEAWRTLEAGPDGKIVVQIADGHEPARPR
jgi:NADPH:quinone reductase-like Zn-dependent oxidoreductase